MQRLRQREDAQKEQEGSGKSLYEVTSPHQKAEEYQQFRLTKLMTQDQRSRATVRHRLHGAEHTTCNRTTTTGPGHPHTPGHRVNRPTHSSDNVFHRQSIKTISSCAAHQYRLCPHNKAQGRLTMTITYPIIPGRCKSKDWKKRMHIATHVWTSHAVTEQGDAT